MASTATQTQSQQCRPREAAYEQRVRGASAVSVALHRRGCAVLLELEERRSSGSRVVLITSFTQASSFEAWCTDDPLRFEEPIVHQQMRRRAEELWQVDS